MMRGKINAMSKSPMKGQKKNDLSHKSWFVMSYELKPITVKDDAGVRFPETFVEKFLLEFTEKGDRILDPFAGFGTTLFVAQKLGRIGVGIEYDKRRFEFIRKRLESSSTIIHGDALHLDTYNIELCDFSITSPPYMRFHDKENPLTNYAKSGDYENYLSDIRTIYSHLKKVMKKGAKIVLEVSNTFDDGHPMTPLAWDIAREISKELFFEREIIYCHENGSIKPNMSNHSYCLLFRNK